MTGPFAPPYHLAVFVSRRTGEDAEGYGETARLMLELAAGQPGYLGVDSVRGADGLGITVAYWRDEESLVAWREHAQHAVARRTGRERWYEEFVVHVARVERAYGFTREP
ncbi:antibiotic biosynthesis monooxygenase family protein [Thermoactinospora rubra]|uniref:antibiotic biosynthesis monooxygenase family protein n=1 Tax=Thermoactinospora rubra TaxID=1088767 RepID=UPI0011815B88|nr:antibiotic biosynthesis monooxygenase [Thermoactinospora rubra]